MNEGERDKMLIEIHTSVTVLAEKVKDHDQDLYGNGKPGIKMDVDRLKSFKKFSCWFYSAIMLATIGVIARLVAVKLTQ